MLKKTKIVCTLGPSCRDENTLEGIIMKDLAKSIKTFFTDCAELIDIVVYKGNL